MVKTIRLRDQDSFYAIQWTGDNTEEIREALTKYDIGEIGEYPFEQGEPYRLPVYFKTNNMHCIILYDTGSPRRTCPIKIVNYMAPGDWIVWFKNPLPNAAYGFTVTDEYMQEKGIIETVIVSNVASSEQLYDISYDGSSGGRCKLTNCTKRKDKKILSIEDGVIVLRFTDGFGRDVKVAGVSNVFVTKIKGDDS